LQLSLSINDDISASAPFAGKTALDFFCESDRVVSVDFTFCLSSTFVAVSFSHLTLKIT